MKFLCPSCKAKYQIADDKVAGRSVRMKCRKCGHLIHISKAVTEGSVSRKLPTGRPPPPSAVHAQDQQPGRSPEPPKPARRPPPRPARAGAGESLSSTKPSPGATPPPRANPSPGAAAAARLASAVPGHAPPARPGARSNGNGAGAPFAMTPLAGQPVATSQYDAEDDDEHTVVASVGGLANAFSQAVQSPESGPLSSLSAPADEWYVGINGVPVGPIRLSELRSKAAAGAITAESLVWREGFEEWLPLGTFPELVAIVEEGLSSARASLTPLSPTVAQGFTGQWGATPGAAPAAARTSHPEVYDPFKMPGTPPAEVLSDPFAAPRPAPVAGAAAALERPVVDVDYEVPKRRAGNVAAWVAVVLALGLGLTIGFVVFSRDAKEPIVKYVEVPSKGSATTPAAAQAEQGAEPNAEDAGTEKVAKTSGAVAGGKANPAAPTAAATGKGLSGLSGLAGLSGPGPASGPGSGQKAAAGNGLSSDQIQRTVGQYTGSVKRSCWQPALATRAENASNFAKVSVTINIAPSGAVSGVSTSGDPKGYRGLAGCIASRVRGWKFPASGGPTTANVPFAFAAQ